MTWKNVQATVLHDKDDYRYMHWFKTMKEKKQKKKKAREREKDKKSVLGQMPQKGEPLFGIKVKGF